MSLIIVAGCHHLSYVINLIGVEFFRSIRIPLSPSSLTHNFTALQMNRPNYNQQGDKRGFYDSFDRNYDPSQQQQKRMRQSSFSSGNDNTYSTNFPFSSSDSPLSPQYAQMPPTGQKFTPLQLLPYNAPFPRGLSHSDAIICQNVEIFQSPADEGNQSQQLGLRCIHCARNGQRHVDSCILFPSSIETLSSNVRMMIDRHFPRCNVLPENVRQNLDASRQMKQNTYGMNAAVEELNALSFYLYDFCTRNNIVNRQPAQTGIIEGNSTVNTPNSFPTSYSQSSTNTGYPPEGNRNNTQPLPTFPEPQSPGQFKLSPYPLHRNQGKSYDNMPFIQTGQNIWECRYCVHNPVGQRAESYAWYRSHPPEQGFIDHHLRLCTGAMNSTGTMPNYHEKKGFNQQMPQKEFNANIPHGMNYSNAMPPYDQSKPYLPTPKYYNEPMHNYQQQNQHGNEMYNYNQQFSDPYMQPQMPPHNQMYQPPMPSLNTNSGHGPRKPSPHDGPSDMNIDSAEKYEIKEADETLSKMNSESTVKDMFLNLLEESDRPLLTDFFYHVMKQLRICKFQEADRTTRGGKRDNVEIGYGGLECKHCCGTPTPRKFFWANVDRLSNSFSEIPGHILKCKSCPTEVKEAIKTLKKHHHKQMREKSRGSQKTFLRRVWRRMHEETTPSAGDDNPDISDSTSADITSNTKSIISQESDSTTRESTKDAPAVLLHAEKAAAILAGFDSAKGSSRRISLAIEEDKDWGLSDLDIFARKRLELFIVSKDEVSSLL